MQVILNGNRLPDGAVITGVHTVCELIEGTNTYKVIIIPHNKILFEPDWKDHSLRGYQKIADVPEEHKFDMSKANVYSVMRIPENGSIYFVQVS